MDGKSAKAETFTQYIYSLILSGTGRFFLIFELVLLSREEAHGVEEVGIGNLRGRGLEMRQWDLFIF